MVKADSWAQDLQDLYFQNQDALGIGDAGGLLGSVVAGNVQLSLHTADPTAAGSQTSSEATFTGYARVAVPRDGTNWVRAGQSVTNLLTIAWPTNTGTSQVATHVGVGDAVSGAGVLRYIATFIVAVTITNGMAFQFLPGELAFNEA